MEQVFYLVTGAAGFLGSHVCDELLARGERVRALVLPGDKSAKYIPGEVEIVEGPRPLRFDADGNLLDFS